MKEKTFRLLRDGRALDDKLKEGYVHVDAHVRSENFRAAMPAGPNAEEAALVNFEEYVFSDDVVNRMERLGLRPGLPTELADLSASHPGSREFAGCFPLVSLGDSWVGPLGNLLVVYLVGDANGRELSLHWRDSGWMETYWFIGFRR